MSLQSPSRDAWGAGRGAVGRRGRIVSFFYKIYLTEKSESARIISGGAGWPQLAERLNQQINHHGRRMRKYPDRGGRKVAFFAWGG